MILHLWGIGNKHLWWLVQRSLLNGGARQWTNSRQHCPAVKPPPAVQWACCSRLSGTYILYAGLLSAPSGSVTKFTVHICNSLISLQASTLQVSAKSISEHNKDIYCSWTYVLQLVLLVFLPKDTRLSDQRGNKEHQPITLNQFDTDVHLQKSLRHRHHRKVNII